MKEPKLEFSISGQRIIVDMEVALRRQVNELFDKVADIRAKHSVYGKYPFETNETREQWAERISKESQDELTRTEDESAGDHLKRLFESKSEVSLMVPEVFNAICETFGYKTFTDKDFDEVKWQKVKRFLADVLTACNVPGADDFRPEVLGK